MIKETITVEIKSTYGMDRIYPVCDTAKLFACIAGTKTLSANNIRTIRDIGFKITRKDSATVDGLKFDD